MKLKNLKRESIELPKRTYVDAVLTHTCEMCGNKLERDFLGSYLMYPVTGEETEVTLCCEWNDKEDVEGCGTEYTAYVILQPLTLKLVKP